MQVKGPALKPNTDSIPASSPARCAQQELIQDHTMMRLKTGLVPGICRIEGPVETLSWDAVEKQKLGTPCLHQYLIPNNTDQSSPLLIKGVVQHWPALQRWSLEWLAEHFPEQR